MNLNFGSNARPQTHKDEYSDLPSQNKRVWLLIRKC